MKFDHEALTPQLVSELTTLILDLYGEVGGAAMPVDPDWAQYSALQELGALHLFTVRNDNDELVGYSTYMITPMLHYKGYTIAMQDTIYLLPDFRGGSVGGELLLFAEKKLTKLGVAYITAVTKVDFDFSPLLLRSNYVAHETAFMKKI